MYPFHGNQRLSQVRSHVDEREISVERKGTKQQVHPAIAMDDKSLEQGETVAGNEGNPDRGGFVTEGNAEAEASQACSDELLDRSHDLHVYDPI
jgi:hypothetical protein